MIDIMMPFWGTPAYLCQAVDSVLAQNSPDWRLTVIDDCYPDPDVARYFATLHDDRVQYVRNEKNLGIVGNFSRCIDLAHSDHMSFLGCDDLLLPDYVATITDAWLRFPDAEMIQPGVQVISREGTAYEPLSDRVKRWLTPHSVSGKVLAGEALACSLLHGNWLYWPSLVFRTEAIREVGFMSDYSIILDLGAELEMIRRGARLVVLPDVVFSYRRHESSASSATLMDGTRFADERSFFALQARRMTQRGWKRAAKAARMHLTSRLYAMTLLTEAIKNHRSGAVRALIHHVIAATPEAK